MAPFTTDAWHEIEPIRKAIDALPFLTGLRDGTLTRERFVYYMAQDAQYLGAFARVLASCAAQATDPGEVSFWSGGAQRAIAVERALHATHVADQTGVERSPTCTAYTSYLLALTGGGSHATVVAGVLPCFWIYEDVGRRLTSDVAGVRDHPYSDWISTYGDPTFAAATAQAKDVANVLAQEAGPSTLRAMHEAFSTAARYEWMFWDAAWRQEVWPV